MAGEVSNNWLARCSRSAPTSDKRRLAMLVLDAYELFVRICLERKVKTRRSFWDMMAGMRQVGPRGYEFFDDFTPMCSGEAVFLIPVLREACLRYGRTPPPGAVSMDVPPLSHRSPQTTKWENLQLKTPPPTIVFQGSVFRPASDGVYTALHTSMSFRPGMDERSFAAFRTSVVGQISILHSVNLARSPVLKAV